MFKRFFDDFLRLVSFVNRIVERGLAFAIVKIVRFYQLAISPTLGPCCRFTPTCSQYCLLAIQKYGAFVGVLKTVGRVLRCHPFSRGGYDPP